MRTLLAVEQVLRLRLKECPNDLAIKKQLEHVQHLIREMRGLK